MSPRVLPLTLLMVAALSGCGGGSGSSSGNNQSTSNVGSLNTGYWQDLHPENLAYTTNSVSGVTDSSGKFYYKCPIQGCEGISFSIGSIIIGSAIGQSGLNLASLNGGMSNGLLSATTLNRAQFLYTFDSDANPTNGITLPTQLANTFKYSSLDFTSNGFATALQNLITQAQQDSSLDANYRNNLSTPSVADARSMVEQANIALNGVFVESPTLPGVNVSTVRQYMVNFPSNFTVSYHGSSNSVSQLANGALHPALGAGLTFVSGSTQGTVTLQAVTSRGIAVNAPNYSDGSSIAPATVLLSAATAPTMATLSLSASGLAVTSVTPLSTQQGNAYSGSPLPPGSSGSFGERNLSEALAPVTPQEFDVDGLDPAGITSAPDGSFWICDRRGPFLIQVDAAGHTRLRLGPQGSLGNLPYVTRLLPAILESRQRDLGCGGITRRPMSNDIVMAVGAALNPGGNSAVNAIFTRLVSYNPSSQAIHQYAVALQAGDHNLQVLDMAALSDSSLLLLVHYMDAQNADQWEIRQINLANATDIQNLLLTNGPNANRELEYGTAAEILASNVTLVVPTTVLSLNAIGWTRNNLQSMALIDNHTIAIMTDNDGGVTSTVTGGANGSDPVRYQVDNHGVISPRANLSTPAQWSPIATKYVDRQTLFWLISLTNPLTP
jgi:Esterase-like activity of phytase